METGLKDVGNNQGNFLMSDYLLYPNEYTFEKMTDSFFLNDSFFVFAKSKNILE